MPRQDGRIEQGQSLKTAISARAWNRAQDAADIVLGQRYGLTEGNGVAASPAALVVPCLVSTTVQNVRVGHVVKIAAAGLTRVPTSVTGGGVATVNTLTAEVIQAVSLDYYPNAKVQLGVIVGGVTMPTPQANRIVQVCISGLCVARVRERAGNFLQGPVVRADDDADDLAGAAESCTCGSQRIIHYLGSVPQSQVLRFAVVLL